MKLKKRESRAEEDLARYCAKCGTPLPSNHKQKNCDSCNREDSDNFRKGVAIAVGTPVLIGLVKRVLPKIIKKF